MPQLRLFTYADRPELETRGDDLVSMWPTFMYKDPTADIGYPAMYAAYPECQLFLVDENDQTVAASNALPLSWDGAPDNLPDGWDDALLRGKAEIEAGIVPNTLCALMAVVSPRFLGQGMGYEILKAMRLLATSRGYQALIAPVRPSHKSRYPLTPIERYISWQTEDGLHFDPWMRVHQRVGARIVKVAPRSMVIPGTVAAWESWTDMRFPDSGKYIVAGALAPLTIDRQADRGLYVEPNVWMVHWLEHRPLSEQRDQPAS